MLPITVRISCFATQHRGERSGGQGSVTRYDAWPRELRPSKGRPSANASTPRLGRPPALGRLPERRPGRPAPTLQLRTPPGRNAAARTDPNLPGHACAAMTRVTRVGAGDRASRRGNARAPRRSRTCVGNSALRPPPSASSSPTSPTAPSCGTGQRRCSRRPNGTGTRSTSTGIRSGRRSRSPWTARRPRPRRPRPGGADPSATAALRDQRGGNSRGEGFAAGPAASCAYVWTPSSPNANRSVTNSSTSADTYAPATPIPSGSPGPIRSMRAPRHSPTPVS